ncbi:MAG: ornithine carbamoyltransferase [Candidatus Tectomicrobia bacterium]|uniref:Ornithine carbamoyltransferase n=1 Tax=Tectimicrobiota bacterium TaxID=2528274 RepID=A0A932I1A6_UNCTE|nr:ornithine carbamoyltransferase [Candidatus Tectomicrobia bacterium]
MKDYLDGTELSAEKTRELLREALDRKRRGRSARSASLAGKTLALLFEKHSTRTRVSFEAGVAQLGGRTIFLSPQDTQLARGETPADSARVLSEYVDGIVVRTFGHERVEEIARHASVPVINGLTDLHHPCQALADFLTLLERFGRLEGLKLAYLGDGNNVAHSLLLVGALIGVRVSVACPPELQPDAGVVARARELAAASGAIIQITNEIQAACGGAHALYTDVWTSMGQEGEEALRHELLTPYRVHGETFHWADKDAVFMHCLPAHRGEEVSAEVIDGPRSVVFQQAGNRLHAQKILLEVLLGGNDGR